MLKKPLRVTIVTNILPSYREGFYNNILSNPDFHIKIYCQENIPGTNFKTIHDKFVDNVELVKHFSLKNEKVSWQLIPWLKILKNSDVIFANGNPRVLSDVLFSFILFFFRRDKSILWTMGHSFNSNSVTEKIRLLWSKLFKYIFLYTDKEVLYLRKKGFNNHIMVGMNNGLDQRKIDTISNSWTADKLARWKELYNFQNKTLLLSCARLIEKNEFGKFLNILPELVKEYPNLIWVVIGNGDQKDNLVNKAKHLKISNNIIFLGEIYDLAELAPWFLNSTLFVHPAAIGLSILQSFGFGLPVITHNNELLHGPEFSAFENLKTGISYDYGNYDDLKKKIILLLNNEGEIKQMKERCLTAVRESYNVDIMAKRFLDFASYVSKRKDEDSAN